MDPKHYWTNKHFSYSTQPWVDQPSIFATQVLKYFPSQGFILELGCGQGADAKFFAESGYQVIATDFSQYALKQASRKLPDHLKPRVTFELVDLSLPLPYEPSSFDVIYSHLSLHYFTTPRTTILFSEIYELLRPGGLFACMVNSSLDPEVGISYRLEDELYRDSKGLQKRYFSLKSFQKLVTKYESLLLDNQGESYKDQSKRVHNLIRFIGKKP